MNSKQFTAEQAKTITDLLNTIGLDDLPALSTALDDVMHESDEERAAAYVEARAQLRTLRILVARLDVAWCDPAGQWNDESTEARQ